MDQSRSSTPDMTSTTNTQHHDSISNENDEVVTPQPRNSISAETSNNKNGSTPSAVGASWGTSTASPHRRSSLPWAIESTKNAANAAASFALTSSTGSTNSSPAITRRASVSPDAISATPTSGTPVNSNSTSQPYVPPHVMMANHAAEFIGLATRRSSLTSKDDKEITRSLGSSSGSSASSPVRGGLTSSTSNTSTTAFSSMDNDSAGGSLREEEEDAFEHYVPPKLRTRSKSINSFDPVFSKLRDFASSAEEHPSQNNSTNNSQQDLSSIWGRFQLGSSSSFHNLQAMGAPPASSSNAMDLPLNSLAGTLPHRRSSTFSYPTPWENTGLPITRGPRMNSSNVMGSGSFTSMASLAAAAAAMNNDHENGIVGGLGNLHARSLPGSTFNSPDQFNRLRKSNRYPMNTDAMTSEQYDQVSNLPLKNSSSNNAARRFVNPNSAAAAAGLEQFAPRRHSVAGPMNFALQNRYLADALHGMSIEDMTMNNAAAAAAMNEYNVPAHAFYNQMLSDMDEFYDPSMMQHPAAAAALLGVSASSAMPGYGNPLLANAGSLARHSISGPVSTATSSAFNEVGRGIPLHALPSNTPLYIVEFKAGRSDIFYVAEGSGLTIHKGDLVIVEADRGKDLGKVINHSITPHQIHMLQAQQPDALSELHRVNKEIHPKRIYRLAQPPEITMLVTKSQDEAKAMAVCQTKVRQKKLSMEVVDAEYQWDRRKLTFYFVADRRIDFRELVRDLFKIYKTRIWMCAVNSIHKAPQSMMYMDHVVNEKAASLSSNNTTSPSPLPSSLRLHPSAMNGITNPTTTMMEPTSTTVA